MASPPSSSPPDSVGGADESALIRRLTVGDASALEELYDRYGRATYSLARRVLADEVLAEDVVQEVFLALWNDPGRFEVSRGSFGSWLLAMTHHKAVDAVRREESVRRRQQRAEETVVADDVMSASVEDEVARSIANDDVRSALRDLPDAQREALTLAYFGGYTQREVAALTDTPLGTVKTRMLAGMRALRGRLRGSREAAEGLGAENGRTT